MGHALESLKNRYNNMSIQLKATFWFTVCNFLQRGISMITTPIFTRMLSTEEYGKYSTYLSWESVMFLIVSLSLYKSMMNLYVKHSNKETVLSSICGLEIIFSTIWLIFAFAFRDKVASIMGITSVLVVCMFLYFVFYAGVQCWSLYKRYIYDYKILVCATLVISVGSPVLGAILVMCVSPTAEARAIATVITVTVVGVLIYLSVFKRNHAIFQKDIWKFALGFCLPLMPHYLSEFILQSSDKIMINYMCGSHDVAIYSIAYSVGSIINLVTNAINSSFAPYQYQKIEAKEYQTLAKRANQVLGFVAVMLCALMLMSREIVLIFGGEKYLESVAVIIPICIGVYFNYLFQLFARVQEYFERKLTVVIPSILCAALNLVLNYIFINIYGYQAAAYTTFVCYFVFCCIHYLFYRKVCREMLQGQNLYNMKGLASISLFVILAGILIAIVSNFPVLKYSLIACAFIILVIRRNKLIDFLKTIMQK